MDFILDQELPICRHEGRNSYVDKASGGQLYEHSEDTAIGAILWNWYQTCSGKFSSHCV